ncbi:MAG: hypothetical protein K8R41_11190 [Bacteroidales bacterium]|nr:hypothetical protein [Bacteroidales bacterium]
MNLKKLFPIILLTLGLLIFSGCYKRAELGSMYKIEVNYEITVLNNVSQPVIGEFVYYRMFKFTGFSNTASDIDEDKELTDNNGKIYLTYICLLSPAEIVRLFCMLNGFDDPNIKLETVFYDEVEAASTDGENALIDRKITLYKD